MAARSSHKRALFAGDGQGKTLSIKYLAALRIRFV